MSAVTIGWPLALLLVALTGAAALVVRLAGLGSAPSIVIAGVRAVTQLLAVSAVIAFVLR